MAQSSSILSLLQSDPNFSQFAALVGADSQLRSILGGNIGGGVTVFAPVNSAFNTGFMRSYKTKYLSDPKNAAALNAFLNNHVVVGY